MATATKEYNEVNIQVLEGLEHVRTRPSMYVGDTGKKGLHHLFTEILDNSIDEAMGGHCTEIDIHIASDGETITITDNGRGIPVGEHKDKKISALEVVMTTLFSGGKFDSSGYEASGGLHGVGASCVNALSDLMTVEVCRDGGVYSQTYVRAVPKAKVKKIRDIGNGDMKHGTKVTFHPDSEIFKEGIKFDEAVILKRLREVAFLNRGLKLNYSNDNTKHKEAFIANGGIADYVAYLTEARTGHYPSSPIYGETKKQLETREGTVVVQFALNYTAEDDETIISFANNINTVDGGTHLSGFKTILTRVVNNFAHNTDLLSDKDPNLSGDDIREGLTGIISVRLPQPEFVGQTKAKLGTVEIEGIVSSAVGEMLTAYFDKNAAVIKKIVERAIIAQEARDAAKKASAMIRKKILGKSRLPGKLSDCNSEKMEECELYIVEGNSAAGSSKDGRDSNTQAILPLRGKVINAEKNTVEQLLKNAEIQNLILAIGTNFKDQFNIANLRYKKVIIMCDADSDGEHICILLITFFYRYMKQLVTDGHVYLAMPPLFRVDDSGTKTYCYDQKALNTQLAKSSNKARVTRFKGLGEMDAEELGETTMDKKNRQLIQLTVNDVGEAERLVSILMGGNAQARKDHITNAVNSLIEQEIK